MELSVPMTFPETYSHQNFGSGNAVYETLCGSNGIIYEKHCNMYVGSGKVFNTLDECKDGSTMACTLASTSRRLLSAAVRRLAAVTVQAELKMTMSQDKAAAVQTQSAHSNFTDSLSNEISSSVASHPSLKAVGSFTASPVTAKTSAKTLPMPIDCQGTYESTPCYGGYWGRIFRMTTAPENGGNACPTEDVTVYGCPHSEIETNWSYVVPKVSWSSDSAGLHGREIPLIVCPFGSKVSFTWSGTMHDIWQLPSEESYNRCDFQSSGAQKRSDAATSSSYEFQCDTIGTHYFACSVDDACSSGRQKVRVYVSNPRKTVELRARGGVSLEEFNRKYTLIFAGYFLNQQTLSVNNANQALIDAQSVLSGSPESCADWIPESWNSNQSCQAFVYTDLGFLSRARPDPDFDASERYYNIALQISPGMCGATAYLAELRVQQNRRADADVHYMKACEACGMDNMDFHDLVLAYQNRSWTPPSCSNSSTPVARESNATNANTSAFMATTTTQVVEVRGSQAASASLTCPAIAFIMYASSVFTITGY